MEKFFKSGRAQRSRGNHVFLKWRFGTAIRLNRDDRVEDGIDCARRRTIGNACEWIEEPGKIHIAVGGKTDQSDGNCGINVRVSIFQADPFIVSEKERSIAFDRQTNRASEV